MVIEVIIKGFKETSASDDVAAPSLHFDRV
jgi:hypothetical protein